MESADTSVNGHKGTVTGPADEVAMEHACQGMMEKNHGIFAPLAMNASLLRNGVMESMIVRMDLMRPNALSVLTL